MTTPQESSPLGAFLRYIRILWKRRLLVGCGSIVPALVLAGAVYFQARAYKVSFVYERLLTENEYTVLLRRFYSSENLGKIAGVLRQKGLADYAGRFDKAKAEESLQQLVGFKVFPAYPKRSQTTDPLVSERIGAFQARLLYVDILGDSRPNTEVISDVITANIENVLPIYDVRTDLKDAIRQAQMQVMDIEDRRFTMSVDLQQEQAKLTAMMKIEEDSAATGGALNAVGPQSGIMLQVTNDPNNRELLPWSYQMRAIQAKIVDLQQSLTAGQQRYQYYVRIVDLNTKLLDRVEQSLLKSYTIQEFVGFLRQELDQYKDAGVADHLRSCIRKTQNRILINTRAGEKPIIYPVAKGTINSGIVAFVVALMTTSFVAVALEYQNGRGKPT